MPLQFRGTADLHGAVLKGIPLLPRDLDLVVGVPRSGLIPAALISTYLALPLTDVNGFLEGRLLRSAPGADQRVDEAEIVRRARRVLIIDDSVGHGSEMRRVRARLAGMEAHRSLHFAAVFAAPDAASVVDVAFEELARGRFFSWNLMHHEALEQSCVDGDRLLWSAAVGGEHAGQHDDADIEDEAAVAPLWRPTIELGWIVTEQPEGRRAATEAWLCDTGIRFRHLVMPEHPLEANEDGAAFKAEVYRRSGARLFLTADPGVARYVTRRVGRPTIAVSAQRMFTPSRRARLAQAFGRLGSGGSRVWRPGKGTPRS